MGRPLYKLKDERQLNSEDAHSEWLESTLSGLLAAGVTKEEIEIQFHPNSVLVVAVSGEPRYRFQLQ